MRPRYDGYGWGPQSSARHRGDAWASLGAGTTAGQKLMVFCHGMVSDEAVFHRSHRLFDGLYFDKNMPIEIKLSLF